MANVKILALEDGETWATFGSVIELSEDDFDKLSTGEESLSDLYKRKAFISEHDVLTGKDIG
jgi:hypothetical protein